VSLNLIEELESRRGAMKVSELTELLGVDDKHIYRMAARELPRRWRRPLRPPRGRELVASEVWRPIAPSQEDSTARGCAFAGGIERSVVRQGRSV